MHYKRNSVAASFMGLAAGILAGCLSVPAGHMAVSSNQAAAKRACEQSPEDPPYTAACASLNSPRSYTPILDIPSSTQVITRQIMDDQKSLRVGDALRNVSGVQGGR